jgi:hypothetical protein
MKNSSSGNSYLALVVAFVAVSQAFSAEVIYEPFDYAAGGIAGAQTNGVGMSGAWATATGDGGTLYSMVSGALSFTNLPTSGIVRAKRATAPGGAQLYRVISSASQDALLNDNSTIWFSVLLMDERFSAGNENGTLALTSGAFSNHGGADGGVLPTLTGGNGFGVTLGVGTEFRVYAYRIVNGAAERTTDYYAGSPTAGGTYLIAGKIDWGENYAGHTLRLFNITDPASPPPDDNTAFASFSGDFDQSTLNTIAIGNRQVSSVDEIRFALTYYEALGREVPPSAGTVFVIK